jgi:imidazolonepropionase-like amidohydrolase
MKSNNTIFVPTLSVFDNNTAFPFEEVLASTKRAWSLGVQLACGGDTGAFPGGHGANAKEMELMIKAGVPVEEVMAACMNGGWKACGGDLCGRRFGYLGAGWAADIIGLEADPRKDVSAFRKVSFVMKDAKVWKQDGAAVGMV